MATITKSNLQNILFQVPAPLKKMLEIRIFELGFASQSDYLKYLIRKDLDEQQKQMELHKSLIAEIQEIGQNIDFEKVPPLEEQLADL